MTRTEQYVSIADLAGQRGWPGKTALWTLVRRHKIKRYKFAGDKKTYVKRSDLERVVRTPEERK